MSFAVVARCPGGFFTRSRGGDTSAATLDEDDTAGIAKGWEYGEEYTWDER